MAEEMTGFDLQVLNLAMLQRSELEFTHNGIGVTGIGWFEYEKGALQLKHSNPSKWNRALSPAGAAALGKLHQELLQAPLDFDAMKAEREAEKAEQSALLGQVTGYSAQTLRQQADAMRNQIGSDQAGARAYAARVINAPIVAPPPLKKKGFLDF